MGGWPSLVLFLSAVVLPAVAPTIHDLHRAMPCRYKYQQCLLPVFITSSPPKSSVSAFDMGSPSVFLIILIALAKFAVCHGSPITLTFQDYWNLMLHDTPMPSAIRDHLIDESSTTAVPTGSAESHTDPILLRRGNIYGDGAVGGGNIPQSSGRVLGVKPDVTVDLDRKPFPFNKKSGGRHSVILGVNGKPVTVDLDLKPFPLIYYGSKNLPVEVGFGGAAHHDHDDDDVINNVNARNFFLEKDLHVGAKLLTVLSRGLSGDTFLHREVADGIPFSSQETMEILRRFGVQPGSPMANKMELMIRRCEEPGNAEERPFCTTSFESLVDYVISSMGTNDLETLTTSVTGSGRGDVPPTLDQVYTVRSWTVVSTPNTTATACHVLKYPYTIFYCHRTPRSRTYVLKMVGEDGTTVDAVTTCHTDTSMWSPRYYVFRAFGLRPGEETICHLVPDGDVRWLPRRGSRAAAAASL